MKNVFRTLMNVLFGIPGFSFGAMSCLKSVWISQKRLSNWQSTLGTRVISPNAIRELTTQLTMFLKKSA